MCATDAIAVAFEFARPPYYSTPLQVPAVRVAVAVPTARTPVCVNYLS